VVSAPQHFETREAWQRTLGSDRSALLLRHTLRTATACYAIEIRDQSGRVWSIGVPTRHGGPPPPFAVHPVQPRLLIALGRDVFVLERAEAEIRVLAQRRLRADALTVFTGLSIPGFVVLHESGAMALTCQGDPVWQRAMRGVTGWSMSSVNSVRVALRNTLFRELNLLDGRVRLG
jgi:hypothetical protein